MPLCIQPALEDQHGRHLVDNILAVAHSTTHRIQVAMCLGGAHPFVPQVHRQAEFSAQCIGEFFHHLRARTAIAGKVNRPSDDNCGTSVSPQQTAH